MQEKISLSILIPSKNEEKNLASCLEPIYKWADEIVLIDSNSKDKTVSIAESFGVEVIQFTYKGGWPKKRQWALNNFKFKNDWVLLLDSDEILTDGVKIEIEESIESSTVSGYWIRFQIYFLGKQLRYGGSELWKLSLFRLGYGGYEKRLDQQDESMADMEIHEHVVVEGKTEKLKMPIKHMNINSLSRYIVKHDEYSNWESAVHIQGVVGEIEANLFGNQAQRRRWLRKRLLMMPGSPFCIFILGYFLKFGFLDGKQGFIYAMLRSIHIYNVKIKIFERKLNK